MVDTWSSMDSSNSPLTDSGPSASDDCTPSTSSEPHRGHPDGASPQSPGVRRISVQDMTPKPLARQIPPKDKPRPRDLTLPLEPLEPRRPHFLDEDYQSPSKSNIECRIPKPHFLDHTHTPSPDEFDERSDITNPNFLEDDVDADENAQKRSGALPKKPPKPHEDRPHRTSYRSTLHYGLDAARSSERDKRASQLYRGTWPGERDIWTGHDSASVRSFSSNGSADSTRPSSKLENKIECVLSLISLLSLSPENNADLSGPLLEMSRSVESCIAMRQAGCIPLLVQLIHSKVARETRDRAAKALRNIIHTQTDDKAGRREARVWRLLEQVREYCYVLEDLIEVKKVGKEVIEDDAMKHPSQSVAALMKLSFDEEHRHVVCQLGGLQALASLVSSDQAAHGSRTGDNTCLTMRKYAGMTLTNLTFGDGNNKSLLCSFKDFMMALVEQLESPNDDMRQVTAAVLRNLSWRADTNSKQVLREVGAVSGLTRAAMTCQKEATLKSVLSALWNLTAHCSMNKVALCTVDGSLGFLVDMLSYDSPTKTLAIVENAGGIMRNVSSHIAVREDYRQILRERNCLSVLLQHLKSPSLTVVSNSCGTLWNLSARCPQDQQFLWDQGAVPMLRSLIHSKHKMIAMGSSAALKNLLNSKPGKTHIISLDTTARNMNLPALPTLGARKQKALEQELDQNLAETCDNIEPATSPTTTNRDEKNLFTATERQIAMNLERHRMSSSSPMMGTLPSQISLSHSPHLSGYLSCSNTLLKGAMTGRTTNGGSANNVNRSDSKDSVTSAQSDTVFEKVMRTGKVPIPTPRNKDPASEAFKAAASKTKDGFIYPIQPPIPPPRTTTEMRTNYTESGYDVDQDSCDQPIDYSRKYSETKTESEPSLIEKPKETTKKFGKKESTFGDYQETDLDQPTDYSLRYAEHPSENGSDTEPPAPSIHEDTIKHFATEGTPYETPVNFSTATSMSDLRVIGKEKPKPSVKENPEVMTHSDEKDTCSIEDPPRPDNDRAISTSQRPEPAKREVFDTKFSSGMASPEKPISYCDEGTPGYFSRVSSLSSLGEPTEEDHLAKKNAMATIHPEQVEEHNMNSSVKDKEGSKAVTFASDPVAQLSEPTTPGRASVRTSSPVPGRFVEDTPLMFSRSSSLGSLPDCGPDDQGSVVSEVSRLTSGCISPSEIPDSPTQSAPLSPRGPRNASPPQDAPPESPPEHSGNADVFTERVTRYVVEHTPAQLSGATSLSNLTIDDEPKQSFNIGAIEEEPAVADNGKTATLTSNRNYLRDPNETPSRDEVTKGIQTPGDSCQVYFTEDTPAILSTCGSHGNLSALSMDSAPTPQRSAPQPVHADSSDSSNLSDGGELLEQYIQKGIAKVVKNKGPPSDVSHYSARHDVYRSMPPYLRSSTETVRMCHDFHPNLPDSRSTSSDRSSRPEDSPPPPLPPKTAYHAAPPRPPPLDDLQRPNGRRAETESLAKTEAVTREKPKLPTTSNLGRNDSLSSLSLDSFGSTDREIFEETVKAGLSSVNPKSKQILDSKVKAHSVERPTEISRHSRIHKSLDRNDRIIQPRPKTRDPEFERNLAAGAYTIKSSSQMKMLEESLTLTRSPYSYHGDATNSFAHNSRFRGFNPRYYDDGPPSLPTRIDEPRRPLERSNSLSSLSNDSFGSTDKEVFERCVRIGISRAQVKKRDDAKLRVRSDDRLEAHRLRRRRESKSTQGALDKMIGDEYSKDRAILEEAIARGAGELKTSSKNVQAPPTDRAPEGERGKNARSTPIGCEANDSALDTSTDLDTTQESVKSVNVLDKSNELPTVDSGNTTFESEDLNIMEQSNECLAPRSGNTTIESFKDELNRSNESYADVLDGTLSDIESSPQNYEVSTLTRRNKNNLEWTDIKYADKPSNLEDTSRKSTDTWNDNTCPDDITFPTISGSIHMISSIRSEVLDAGMILPDLLEKSEVSMSSSRPDLTNKLEEDHMGHSFNMQVVGEKEDCDRLLESVQEPSYTSLVEDGEHKFHSISIEEEAARLADQLKNTQLAMEQSATSLASLDLEHVKPPSNLGSLLSLSASGQFDESSTSKISQKNRKKSFPAQAMVRRALSNSMHQGSSEHLDSNPISFIDNVKPPSEMENIDMESSIISVSSISSDIVETTEKTPIVFDLKQPIQDFPLCNNYVFQDLAAVNPPSLFDEMVESTIESDQTTAQQLYEDCLSTLNVVTDIPSGSENCTPLPSDVSSVESTPKRQRDSNYLTAKEKRIISKDRYQTYTITDSVTDNEILTLDTEQFLTWTKSQSDRSEEYATAISETSENIPKKKLSAKQRRMEDRARYQTQTVEVHLLTHNAQTSSPDPELENLKQRLAAKKTIKQKRIEDAERFKTRTLSEDNPPSPTFVAKDANLENIESTTGYDSLSSSELNHQQILDERRDDDVFSRDSGHNEDDFELNSTQMQTYTKSFRNYLPVIESPASVDMCVVKNLKNMEMTESFTRNQNQNPSSGDFASFEGDSNSDDKVQSDSDTPVLRPKPKITKPEIRRDESLDSNESLDKEETPKPIRGRKKAAYVSPYRRTNSTPTTTKKPLTTVLFKPSVNQKAAAKSNTSAKTQVKTPASSKASSANTSPKRIPPTRTFVKTQQRPVSIPLVATKPLPLERQGTFTKEDSTVPPQELSIPDKKTTNVPRFSKATTPTKPANTSPSRLPQFSRSKVRPPLHKTNSNENQSASKTTNTKRTFEPGIKNSISNQSLQSNDSGKTVTLNKSSRPGSTSSVNSGASKTRDVESRIANLWKKVDQTKKQPSKPDKRVWIEADKDATPKLIRSSTFEGKPKQAQVSSAPKQKTSIGIRVSQIPSLKQKPLQNKNTSQSNVTKKPTTSRVFTRKPVNQVVP